MSRIRRKLTVFELLVQGHCGYEELVHKAVVCRLELERMIEEGLWEEHRRGGLNVQEVSRQEGGGVK